MVKAIIELSNYILVLNLLLYTIISFVLLPKEDEERSSFLLVLQDVFIFINHLTGSLVLLSTRHDMTYLFYPVFQMIAIFSFFVLMRAKKECIENFFGTSFAGCQLCYSDQIIL